MRKTFRARRALIGSALVPAGIEVDTGTGLIVAVHTGAEYEAALARDAAVGMDSGHAATGALVVNVPDEAIMLPAGVDCHVHVNEPGRTAWEGFASATEAAAYGGIGTIVDMPLNSIPPTVDTDALAVKRAVATGQLFVETGLWGGAVPDNLGRLEELWAQGVFGFKCFLVDSGVPEFPPLLGDDFEAAMAEVASFGGLMIVHAEDPDVLGSIGLVEPPLRRLRRVAAARGRGAGGRDGDRTGAPARHPRAHSAREQRAGPGADRRGQGRGITPDRRNLPPLPDLRQ